MPNGLRIYLGLFIAALVVGMPVVFTYVSRHEVRNLHVVEDGVLYRSGQLSAKGLKRVVYDHRIKTVISLRDTEDASLPPPDWAEEQWCKKQEINYVRITPRSWDRDESGKAPADIGVRQFLDTVSNADNYPILVHCFAGVHRTGAHCAVYRIERQGWSNARAIEEVRAYGYDNLDRGDDVRTYLEDYRPGRLDRLAGSK